MANNDWFFDEPRNVMVLTSLNIISNNASILWVSHDAEDGMWQFHDGFDVDLKKAMIVSLEEIVKMDTSLNEISDLPLGWKAWRENTQDAWKRKSG